MRVAAVREMPVSLSDPMANAGIGFGGMTASAVAVDVDAGAAGTITGYGFSSVGRYAQSGLIAERFAPRLGGAELAGADGRLDPALALPVMMADEKPGGDGDRAGAVGVLDMALWDAAAKAEDAPLWRLLSKRGGTAAPADVPVYATCGHYREGGLGALRDEIRACLDDGHRLVKIKCGLRGPDDDRARVEAALGLLGGDGARLAVDLNCRGATPGEASSAMAALEDYGLAWIEEPAHPHDFESLRALAGRFETPIATGENLFSAAEAGNLLLYGGLRPDRDLVQVDPALAYGIAEYEEILRRAAARGWPRSRMAPHAGHLYALHVVAGLGLGLHEVGAGASLPVCGLPAGVAVRDGTASRPDAPGIGFETHGRLWSILGRLSP